METEIDHSEEYNSDNEDSIESNDKNQHIKEEEMDSHSRKRRMDSDDEHYSKDITTNPEDDQETDNENTDEDDNKILSHPVLKKNRTNSNVDHENIDNSMNENSNELNNEQENNQYEEYEDSIKEERDENDIQIKSENDDEESDELYRRTQDLASRLHVLLEVFPREQLMDLLIKAAIDHPSVNDEIISIANADITYRKIFVRGLPWETTTDKVIQAYEKFGKIEDALVVMDKETGKSKGYGFITFADTSSAQDAIFQENVKIDNREIRCNLAAVRTKSPGEEEGRHHGRRQSQSQQHMQQQPQMLVPMQQFQQQQSHDGGYNYNMLGESNELSERKLFIRGLSYSTSEEMIKKEFLKYGEIETVVIVKEKNSQKSKGFGFITFYNRSAADRALNQPVKKLDGRTVYVNLASRGSSRNKNDGSGNGSSNMMQATPAPQMMVPVSMAGGYMQAGQPQVQSSMYNRAGTSSSNSKMSTYLPPQQQSMQVPPMAQYVAPIVQPAQQQAQYSAYSTGTQYLPNYQQPKQQQQQQQQQVYGTTATAGATTYRAYSNASTTGTTAPRK